MAVIPWHFCDGVLTKDAGPTEFRVAEAHIGITLNAITAINEEH
jgi:hypothetical protein